MATCSTCDGTGLTPGTGMTRCETCQGAGEVTKNSETCSGTFIRSQVCPACGGAGEVIVDPCSTCAGTGTGEGDRDIAGLDTPRRGAW